LDSSKDVIMVAAAGLESPRQARAPLVVTLTVLLQ
jgi:hypothetical protein